MNPYLTQKLKLQFLQPIQLCHLHQTFCRFVIPGYCLIEHSLYYCEYSGCLKDCQTFKERRIDETQSRS